ncbi:MAG: sugar transferase [Deltaproteobacteria bacterium]|nr:sugar transferase [Deltaproteobacteria bacterium]
MNSDSVKRCFDLLFVLFALMVCAPMMLVMAVLIRWRVGNPAIFRQTRIGLNGRPFVLYKFRTMTDGCDQNGHLLPDADRLFPLGTLLRSTSLDEMPGFFNVLKGEMSIVGPRPHLARDLCIYFREQSRRHEVKPGITGWAQVNGRNAINMEKKFRMDVWYVDNRSFVLDLKVVFLTVVKIFKREDIYPHR